MNDEILNVIYNRPMFNRIAYHKNINKYRITVYDTKSSTYSKICIGYSDTYEEAIQVINKYKVDLFIETASKFISSVDNIFNGVVYNNIWIVYKDGVVLDLYGNRIFGDINRYGYVVIRRTNKDGSHYRISLHRLVAICYLPNPDNRPQINHIDGNKLNNDVSNLEWCTPSENIKHAFDHQLMVAKRKYDQIDINEIIDLYNSGIYTLKELTKLFGISNTTILNYARKTWFQPFSQQELCEIFM